MKTLKILISGIVQGVGFRYFARSNAVQYDIKGTVRNTEDGSVECIAQGEVEKMDAFLSVLKRGPYSARVTGFEVSETEAEPFSDFRIKGW